MTIKISAEVGSVHDGSIGNAKKLCEISKNIGADIVKFQTHIAETETLINAPMPPAFKGEPRFQYFKRTGFEYNQWKEIYDHCTELGIEFQSSPFSIESLELLIKLGVKSVKIPSGEVTNIPFLEFISETNLDVIISSGMSSWEELDDAIEILKRNKGKITILQCTSEYPLESERVGLNNITLLKDRYECDVGFSDHTPEIYASLAAVSLGATYIEKHLTYSKFMYGSDAKYAMEIDEFKNLISGIRTIENIINNPTSKDQISDEKKEIKSIYEKSIVLKNSLKKGDVITFDNLAYKKPGNGIKPKNYRQIVGKKVKKE